MYYSHYVVFSKLQGDIRKKSLSLDSNSRKNDSKIFIAKQSAFQRRGNTPLQRSDNRFTYIGIDPPNADTKELTRLENANAAMHFEQDPYACTSPVLAGKRLLRNPFRRMHGYGVTNPALLDLLSWCPESGTKSRWFDKKSLPWDRTDL
jgi:hypothetical protein